MVCINRVTGDQQYDGGGKYRSTLETAHGHQRQEQHRHSINVFLEKRRQCYQHYSHRQAQHHRTTLEYHTSRADHQSDVRRAIYPLEVQHSHHARPKLKRHTIAAIMKQQKHPKPLTLEKRRRHKDKESPKPTRTLKHISNQLQNLNHGAPPPTRSKIFIARDWYADYRAKTRSHQRPNSIIRKLHLNLHSPRRPKAKVTIWPTPEDSTNRSTGNDNESEYTDDVEVDSYEEDTYEDEDGEARLRHHRGSIGGRLKEAINRRKQLRASGDHGNQTRYIQSSRDHRVSLPRPSNIRKEGLIPKYANTAEHGLCSLTSFATATALASILAIVPIIWMMSM
ncbi:hypothetical protein BGW41_000830 [Actinomortierella wolfii]|nr:hypothetical protein BGW41_000830 [Actinomortierella wolfii]